MIQGGAGETGPRRCNRRKRLGNRFIVSFYKRSVSFSVVFLSCDAQIESIKSV